MSSLQTFIERFIDGFLADPETNNLGPGTADKAWEGFLLGFSDGADDSYAFLKQHIGEFHWSPAEAFALGRPAVPAVATDARDDGGSSSDGVDCPTPSADQLTVVSWALCQTQATKEANRAQTRFPSESWARSRIYGQRCARYLQKSLVKALAQQDIAAVAPALLPQWTEIESPAYGRASTWSERHVAYISGLGTFGLCGGLITERGQAARFGSVIVHAKIPPTPRRYSDPFAYCLFYHDGSCTACVDRCPVAAVGPAGRDKDACAQHLEVATADYVKREYGFDGYGCGLCQTGVPCESGIPAPLGASPI